jgi:membrane associated rhomboid family serine protease
MVAHGGRWGALVIVLQAAAFAIPAVIQLCLGKFELILLLPLGIGVALLMRYLPRVWHPFTVEVAGDQIYFDCTHTFHCSAANIGRIFFDGSGIRVYFRDLQALLPDVANTNQQAASELQAALQDSLSRTGTHLNLPGFSVAQTDQLRGALHQPNQGFRDVAEELESFHRTLTTQTPVVWVTPLMVGLNIALFGWMIATGVPLMNPNAGDVLPWGANFGPLTLSGETWRLLACTFLHFGLLHIACNMFALQDGGPMLERLTGNVGFALLYLLAGFFGSYASVMWSPDSVSAGASGAVFGVYGGLVTWHFLRRHDFPPNLFSGMMRGVVPFIAFNLLLGAGSGGIDQAAHIGGLVAGALCGLVLSHPLSAAPLITRLWRNGVLAVVGSVLVYLAIHHLPLPQLAPGFFGELQRFEHLERQLVLKYETARETLNAGQATASDFERVLRSEILPAWNRARLQLRSLKFSSQEQQAQIERLTKFADLRAEAWTLQADAIAKDDILNGFAEAQKKHAEADALISEK